MRWTATVCHSDNLICPVIVYVLYVIESNEIMPCHQQFKSQIFLMTNVKNKINPEIEILEGSKEKDTLKKYYHTIGKI
jgi:hypothetical protein